jgi:glycosyltransferase involved in cell wall biosynthesis
MKLALVHDHLTQEGGAEKVLEVLQETFPSSPTFTLVCDNKKVGKFFDTKKIHTSFLQNLPFAKRGLQWYLPLMPAATESHDLSDFDVVISSSSAFAKGVLTKPEAVHICYCHTPTRYLWSDTHSYLRELKRNFLVKKILPMALSKLRQWDRLAADRVDYFIANSAEVQKRIKKYYQRDSEIIYPPVQTTRFSISPKIGDYYLTGGRLVSYKRFDLTVETFNRLGIKLKIFGDGPEFNELRKKARGNIEFLGRITDADKINLFQNCLAFINPQVEDFGITVIEAMAAGRPVIAYAAGGALETVKAGQTGAFFHEQAWEELADVLIRFKPENFNPQIIKQHASQFDTEVFKRKIIEFTNQKTSVI